MCKINVGKSVLSDVDDMDIRQSGGNKHLLCYLSHRHRRSKGSASADEHDHRLDGLVSSVQLNHEKLSRAEGVSSG